MASELQLPNTVAAAGRTGSDEAADRAVYEAALRSELSPSRMPLERFLVDGGWPNDVVLHLVGVNVDAATIRLTLAVTFDELVTACGGTPDARPRLGEFVIVIDRATGVSMID